MISPVEYRPSWESWLKKWFYRLLVPAILVNAAALFITILEPDGALYATIARTIAKTGDFVNLRVEGKDWLDKPHFPFWIAAISDRIFGATGFAYKFPALLFWGLGAWYTYRLAATLYSKPVAQLSTLIYVSAAHLVISNNDVRAEPYLTGLVIGAVFHFYKASKLPSPALHLVAGSLLAACAVMTKGPFVLITIGGGLVIDWLLKKDFRQFLAPRWWLALLLILVFSLPELICLYWQFDLHPEKIVFGRTGVSGIRFFFWDSQFGRFFNTGPIRGSGDPFFYFHTLLWAFLPWSLLLYAAIVQRFRFFRKNKKNGDGDDRSIAVGGGKPSGPVEFITPGSALVSFFIFSLSRFQLPHYLNMLFPFFAILTAVYLFNVKRRVSLQAIRIAQHTLVVILGIALIALSWLFHFPYYLPVIIVLILLAALPFLLFRGRDITVSIGRSLVAALAVYFFINVILYPAMLRYQSGSEAAFYINGLPDKDRMAGEPVYISGQDHSLFSFACYLDRPVQRIAPEDLRSWLKEQASGGAEKMLFLPQLVTDSLIHEGYPLQEMKRLPHFHISQVSGDFFYYKTRPGSLTWYAVVNTGSR